MTKAFCELSKNTQDFLFAERDFCLAYNAGAITFQWVILSLGVTFDLLQPSAYFLIQDGNRKQLKHLCSQQMHLNCKFWEAA